MELMFDSWRLSELKEPSSSSSRVTPDLGKHGFSVEGDDGALVDVHRDARVVERLLRVPQLVPHVGNAALENGAEVARDQRPVYACNRSRNMLSSCVRHSHFIFGNHKSSQQCGGQC